MLLDRSPVSMATGAALPPAQACLRGQLQQDIYLAHPTRTKVAPAQSPDLLSGKCDSQEHLRRREGPLTLRGSWGGKFGP